MSATEIEGSDDELVSKWYADQASDLDDGRSAAEIFDAIADQWAREDAEAELAAGSAS